MALLVCRTHAWRMTAVARTSLVVARARGRDSELGEQAAGAESGEE